MPRTYTTEVYSFQELLELRERKLVEEKALDKARNWFLEGIDDHWYEYVKENWTEALESIGFEDATIQFSGFSSQGYGASFTAHINVAQLAGFLGFPLAPTDHVGVDAAGRELFPGWVLWKLQRMDHPGNRNFLRLRKLADKDPSLFTAANVQRNSSQYSHEYTCSVHLDWDLPGAADPAAKTFTWNPKHKRLDQLCKTFQKQAEELRLQLCRVIYADLEQEYDYQNSDENYVELSAGNGFYFTCRGAFVRDLPEEGSAYELPKYVPPTQRRPRRRAIACWNQR